jgi:hypothetical protein
MAHFDDTMSQNLTEESFDGDNGNKSYFWWEARAADRSTPLTDEEKAVINACGMLSYIRNWAVSYGDASAKMRTVSNKHRYDCSPGCVCGGLGD